jgi:hypothetical protein
MSEFTIRSESVDVEQIMKQIRTRILEKRGADYTEDQIRELASVRLEKFLDSKNLRSDLLEQFRKSRPAVHTDPPKIEAPYAFDDQTLFASHRAPLRLMRKLLMPILKLFFNPNVLNQILHTQAQFNVDLLKRESRRKIEFDRSRAEWNSLYYEVLHNLVLETTRMGIEVQNLRMRTESLSSRLDFSERRVRALEGVVQYRPEVVRAPERQREQHVDGEPAAAPAASGSSLEGFVPAGGGQPGQGDGSARRRRRRRRGRRGSQGASGAPGASAASGEQASGFSGAGSDGDDSQGFDDGPEDDGPEEMEAAGGFDLPEPADDDDRSEATEAAAATDEPASDRVAPDALRPANSASAPGTPDALRRDKPDTDDDLQ